MSKHYKFKNIKDQANNLLINNEKHVKNLIVVKKQTTETEVVCNLPSEVQNFQEAKILTKKSHVIEHISSVNETRARRIEICGNWLKFNLYQNSSGDIKRTLADARFCLNRWCVVCQMLKSKRLLAELLSIVQQIQEVRQAQNLKPMSFIFLTLTVQNPQLRELNSTIKTMSSAWKQMMKTESFKRAIKGYVRAVEFMGDHTESGFAHPHYHCALAVEPSYFHKFYLSQKEWREMWQSALGVDYDPSVLVRKISAEGLDDGTESIIQGLLEVVKYSVSPVTLENMSREDFLELDKQVKGIRQYSIGGIFRDYEPQLETLDPAVWEFIGQEVYEWFQGAYRTSEKDPFPDKTPK